VTAKIKKTRDIKLQKIHGQAKRGRSRNRPPPLNTPLNAYRYTNSMAETEDSQLNAPLVRILKLQAHVGQLSFKTAARTTVVLRMLIEGSTKRVITDLPDFSVNLDAAQVKI
jgi:hypothetical protein